MRRARGSGRPREGWAGAQRDGMGLMEWKTAWPCRAGCGAGECSEVGRVVVASWCGEGLVGSEGREDMKGEDGGIGPGYGLQLHA